MGVTVTGLEVSEPVERTSQAASRVDPAHIVEIETRQRLGDDRDDSRTYLSCDIS